MSGKSTPRLGRGLAALLGETAIHDRFAEGPPSRVSAVDLLDPGAFQPRRRMAQDALDDLVLSVKSHGVLQPILVRRQRDQPRSL